MAIQEEHTTAPARRPPRIGIATLVVFALTLGTALVGSGTTKTALVAEGQRVFRFDTFGDEQLWTDTLRLHGVVEKSVDPTTALRIGLKLDADALPPGILAKVDLKSPATTVALLKMNAVVGIQASVDSNNLLHQGAL